MRSRPFTLTGLSIVFAIIAVSMPVQVMALYGHSVEELPQVLAKLTVLNWLVILGLISCAALVMQASRWTRVAIPVLVILVGFNNFFVGYHGVDFSKWTAILATFGFAALNLPLARSEIQQLLSDRSRHWWKVAERRHVQMPVLISGKEDLVLPAETFDVSMTGVFISLKDFDYAATELEGHKKISVWLKMDENQPPMRCDGVVVRRTEAKGKYPSGVGIQFTEMSRAQKAKLKKYLEQKTKLESP